MAYYKNKLSGVKCFELESISNGYIFTAYDVKNGIPFGNVSYRFFVSKTEKELWEKIEFIPELTQTEGQKREIRKTVTNILNLIVGQGLIRDSNTLNDFRRIDEDFMAFDRLLDYPTELETPAVFIDRVERGISRSDDYDGLDTEGYVDLLHLVKPIADQLKILLDSGNK